MFVVDPDAPLVPMFTVLVDPLTVAPLPTLYVAAAVEDPKVALVPDAVNVPDAVSVLLTAKVLNKVVAP